MGDGLGSISFFPTVSASGITVAAISAKGAARPISGVAVASPIALSDSVAVRSTGPQSFGLSEIGAALAGPARISNSLAVADNALSALGGLLGEMHATLTQSKQDTQAIDQNSIDAGLANMDRLADTSKFGGKKLLDGTFTVSLNGSVIFLPSFSTSTLGKTLGEASTESLASVGSDGRFSLSNDTPGGAGVVATAIHQVSAARQQIADFQTQAVQPLIEAGQSALEHLIATPVIETTGSALSNAVLARAQGLLRPDATAAIFEPSTDHVLELLR